MRAWSMLMVTLLMTGCVAAQEAPAAADRVAAMAELLVDPPVAPGRPIDDRAAWEALAAHPAFAGVIERAEAILGEPLPEQPDELYLEFSRNGNRTRWQNVAGRRRGRLAPLALAECLENKGRFLPALEETIEALCAERCWLMPAHDGNLKNFRGESIDIDLGSAHLGCNLAYVDRLLGARLHPEVRELLRDKVAERILDPFRDMILGRRPVNWWMTGTNNWNTVCLAGVVGAGMAQLTDREDRARFVLAAQDYSTNFEKGFTADGYCSEGVGYWNYGFGNYLVLHEIVRQATGGRVELLARPASRAPALYGTQIEIVPGVCPAFADCSVTARPDGQFLWYVNRYFGLGLPGAEADGVTAGGNLYDALVWSFANAATERPPAPAAELKPQPRTWFEQAGIYLGRPTGDRTRLAVALKGGHNAEHHNHNDVGSYSVVIGRRPVLLDPGGETYTARTFSNRRYESKLLNSFGHPVPRVGGELQRTGGAAKGVLVRSEFTDTTDTLVFDLKACYAVESLASLTRTFVYSREGEGSLTVTDEVEFTTPTAFGTALICGGDVAMPEPGRILAWWFDEAAEVTYSATGGELALSTERIDEEAAVHPMRVGLDFAAPVTRAAITMTMRPGTDQMAAGGGLLRNGGFEFGSFGWSLPGNGLGSISGERAATGRFSLKVDDQSETQGSNITSAECPAAAGASYVLDGTAWHETGSGIGLYVYYLDAEGRRLNPVDERGNIAPVGSLDGAAGRWAPFGFGFTTPPGTVAVQVWIHSYNGAKVTAYLDDLTIEPAR